MPNLYLFEIQDEQGLGYVVSILPPDAGGIPKEGIVGKAKSAKSPIKHTEFSPNLAFLDLLQKCVERFGPASPNMAMEASKQKDGFIYVIDARSPTPLGSVPPEDIIGAFEVRNGQVHPETYRANPQYRLLTEKGFFILAGC
jgi:hypothetical protein